MNSLQFSYIKRLMSMLLIVLGITVPAMYYHFSSYDFYQGAENFGQGEVDKPSILLLDLQKWYGGTHVHFMSYLKTLKKHGHKVVPVVRVGSDLHKKLIQENISHYISKSFKFSFKKRYWYIGLPRLLASLCRQHEIKIIHCNYMEEMRSVRKAADMINGKAVFTWHSGIHNAKKETLQCAHGFIGVHKKIVDEVRALNEQYSLGIQQCAYIPPFFAAEDFLQFKTEQSRQAFYEKEFGITLAPYPVVIDVSRLFDEKNPQLLLDAAEILINHKRLLFNLVFVGDGSLLQNLKAFVDRNRLEKYVHFTGFTFQTPALIYHADITVLPSKNEALGIVLLEAALMKKPTIGIRGTGMENVIIDGQTGLLSTSGDAQEIADKIEYLLKNPVYAQQLGNKASMHVTQNFLPDVLMTHVEQFYKAVLRS